MNVTRAVLPVMRKQRSGHIISIASSAGLAAGFEFVSERGKIDAFEQGLALAEQDRRDGEVYLVE